MQKELLKNFWTLPNCITLFRLIFGAPVTIWFYANGHSYAWLIFLCFAATDFLDGALSRRQNSGSSWGMLLDPIADQALNLPILWYLALFQGSLFLIIASLMLIWREIRMLCLRVSAKRDVPAMSLGKMKVILEYTGIALWMLGGTFALLSHFVLTVAVFLAYWSLFWYKSFLDEKLPSQ